MVAVDERRWLLSIPPIGGEDSGEVMPDLKWQQRLWKYEMTVRNLREKGRDNTYGRRTVRRRGGRRLRDTRPDGRCCRWRRRRRRGHGCGGPIHETRESVMCAWGVRLEKEGEWKERRRGGGRRRRCTAWGEEAAKDRERKRDRDCPLCVRIERGERNKEGDEEKSSMRRPPLTTTHHRKRKGRRRQSGWGRRMYVWGERYE